MCPITPDILHQLFQGVIKHVIGWVCSAVGDTKIDAKCQHLPLNHHICSFMKGICNLSHVTGTEHDQISQFLLALVLDIQFPGHPGISNQCLVQAVQAILDFVQLARYLVHTDETLGLLNTALQYLAKDAYSATNGKDEFCQMTLWLERKERVFQHDKFLQHFPPQLLKMLKYPSRRAVTFTIL
ncbi:hypothetical protein BDQ17DRAFT_1393427 [Cyathus striatus]|nr:hypothetical protein BDQ17DRAFT_1393427 [Cyathus striatus]